MGNTSLTSDGATNDRCPYCGTDCDRLQDYEAHVPDCQPFTIAA